jgi:hypothetical protein
MGAPGLDSETGESTNLSPSPVFIALGGAKRHARLRLLLGLPGVVISALATIRSEREITGRIGVRLLDQSSVGEVRTSPPHIFHALLCSL